MKSRFTRRLAALLCASMIFTGNGISALAATIDEPVAEEVSVEDAGVEEDGSPVVEISEDADEVIPAEVVEGVEDEAAVEIVEAEEVSSLGSVNEWLSVSANGMLKLADGKTSLAGATDVTIPLSCNGIPAGFFKGYTSLETISINKDCVLTSIGSEAFAYTGIKTILLPAGITEIPDSAFESCKQLTTIEIKGAVTSVGNKAFKGCDELAGLNIPTVETIGNEAFSGCGKLSALTVSALQTIGEKAFYECGKLSAFSFPVGITSIGNHAFYQTGLSAVDLSSVSDSDHKNFLGTNVFENCASLEEVKLSQYLEIIPAYSFYNCPNLNKVEIQSGTEIIGQYAFAKCTSLATISFPATVYQFNKYAFNGCTALTTVSIYYPESGTDIVIDADAFPNKSSKLTMYGFNRVVEEYANGKAYYEFDTLAAKYTVGVGTIKNGKVSASVSEATPGTEIIVTVTPNADYDLTYQALSYKYKGTPYYPEYVSKSSGNVYKFKFTMPDASVTLTATCTKADSLVEGAFTAKLTGKSGYAFIYNEAEKVYSVEQAGSIAQMTVKAATSGTVAPWLMTFKTSNSAVATVDANGMVKAVKAGDAVITATLNSDSKKSVSVKLTVVKTSIIEKIEVSFTDLPKGVKAGKTTIDGKEVSVLVVAPSEFDSAMKLATNKSVKVNLTGYDKYNMKLNATSNWSSIDTSIVSVSATATGDNNTILLKKGASGEATVTVSVKNNVANLPDTTKEERDYIEAVKVVSTQFLVRIADPTPRLGNSTVSVNYNSSAGTLINLNPVYGYRIDNSNLYVSKKNSAGGYERVNKVAVFKYEGDEYRLYADSEIVLAEGKSVTYKDANKLYLSGEIVDTATGNRMAFHTPIDKLTISRTSLKPTVKNTGKINLFYNSTASTENQGSVIVTHNLTNELLADAYLGNDKSELDTALKSNFDVTVSVDKKSVIISRSSSDLEYINNKAVTAGWLYLRYVGYDNYVRVKYTVPTINKAPAFLLSTTETGYTAANVTTNSRLTGQEFYLYLYNKTAKKTEPLDDLVHIGIDSEASTDGMFIKPDVSDAASNGYITLKLKTKAKKSKAVLNLRMDTWETGVKVTFNLNVTDKVAKAVLSSNSITLNNKVLSQEGTIGVKLNQTDAVFEDFDSSSLTYTGGSKTAEEAEKIDIDFDMVETGKFGLIKASLSEEVKNGTYVFKVKPVVAYDGVSAPADYMTFKVVVNSNQPTIKLKASTLTLNAQSYGIEKVGTTYSVTNLPAGVDYSLTAPTSIECSNSKNLIAQDIVENYLDILVEGNQITAKLKGYPYSKTNTVPVVLKGITAAGVEVADVKLNVKCNYAEPSISYKAKGTLNTIDPSSVIAYTLTVKNINSDIAAIRIAELDSDNEAVLDAYDNPTSVSFKVINASADKKYFEIAAASTLDSKVKYKYKIQYQLTADPEAKWFSTKTITINPKQTFPKLSVKASADYMYAGQADASRYITVNIQPTTVTGSVIKEITWAKGTADSVKKAYKIEMSYDTKKNADGTVMVDEDSNPIPDKSKVIMKLTLIDPSKVVAGKKNTLSFETVYENQMDNTTGTVFKIPMTIRK